MQLVSFTELHPSFITALRYLGYTAHLNFLSDSSVVLPIKSIQAVKAGTVFLNPDLESKGDISLDLLRFTEQSIIIPSSTVSFSVVDHDDKLKSDLSTVISSMIMDDTVELLGRLEGIYQVMQCPEEYYKLEQVSTEFETLLEQRDDSFWLSVSDRGMSISLSVHAMLTCGLKSATKANLEFLQTGVFTTPIPQQ